jgi:hypothetical protein
MGMPKFAAEASVGETNDRYLADGRLCAPLAGNRVETRRPRYYGICLGASGLLWDLGGLPIENP